MNGRARILVAVTGVVIGWALGTGLADQPPGYHARPCGFDMNRNGVIGEPADRLVGDGVTADPDGDGVDEDILYVDSTAGSDVTGDGSPGKPYRTVQKALNVCDGPADGAEDIVCIAGVFKEELTLKQSGVTGYYVRDDFQFPRDPFMLVGWDRDGDGEYPPYDTDDEAVLDGNVNPNNFLGLAISNDPYGKSYIEIAHMAVRYYGHHTDGSDQGVLKLSPRTNAVNHIYFHDVEMKSINDGIGTDSTMIVWSFWCGNTTLRHLAFINNLIDGTGTYAARGAPGNGSGYYRTQNNTYRFTTGFYHGSDTPTTGTTWKVWGAHSDVEFLDNVVYHVPMAPGEIGGSGFGVRPCVRNYTIRGNEFYECGSAIGVDGLSDGGCHARRNNNIVIDRNYIRCTSTVFGSLSYQGPIGIHIKEGGLLNETTENVTITNNFFSFTQQNARPIVSSAGNTQSEQPGVVTIAGNTFHGPGFGSNHKGIIIGYVTMPYPQNDFVVRNNIIANVGSSNRNIQVFYAPTRWIANGNVYDSSGRYTWSGSTMTSFTSWKSVTGQDAGSKTGSPMFVDGPAGDLHLDPSDTVARGFGVDISDITEWDFDGDRRDPNIPTAGADVEGAPPDTDPPTITAWSSAAEHSRGIGEALLEIGDGGTFSEPRSGGIRKLVVQFSERMDPVSFTPACVQIAGRDANGAPIDLGSVTIETSMPYGDTVGEITLTPALPDFARYIVQISSATDVAGNPLSGDDERIITALCGDVSGDLRVNATDLSIARVARTRLVDPGSAVEVRADVSADGRVNASDLSRIRARRPNDARSIADPTLP